MWMKRKRSIEHRLRFDRLGRKIFLWGFLSCFLFAIAPLLITIFADAVYEASSGCVVTWEGHASFQGACMIGDFDVTGIAELANIGLAFFVTPLLALVGLKIVALVSIAVGIVNMVRVRRSHIEER